MIVKFFVPKFITISLLFAAILFSSPAMAMMEDYPSVKLQGLDKSVGRTVTFEAKVGSTIQYGSLFVKIHACRKAPPIEKPESAAFLQIWEVPPGQKESQWVFSGWMFASSPALSAMDHPVYDVWVLDCMGKEEPSVIEPEILSDDGQASDQTKPSKTETPPSLFVQEDVVDSEAEDQTSLSSNPNPIQTDGDQPSIMVNPNDEGFTAYDLMKQNSDEVLPDRTIP